MFFDGHKRKDVVKYKKIFFNEIKSLLPHFVKFSDEKFILPKLYPDNCVVGGPHWKSIIMITYDKSIFSANDSW